MMAPRSARTAVGIGWGLLAVFAAAAAYTGGIADAPRLFQACYLVGFAGYFLVLLALRRAPVDAVPGNWTTWLAGMILLRLVLILASPSDDTNRYVWEGRVQNAGFSPYVVPPDDPLLVELRDEVWAGINHPHFPAIYPPLAQLEFRAVAALAPSTYLIKFVHVIWDVLSVVVLGAMLRRRGSRPALAAAYGLCPLVLTAFAIEGHLDSLMILLTLLAVDAADARRLVVAGLALGSAMAAKTIVVVLLPYFVLRSWRVAAVAAVVVVAWYLPFGTTGLDGLGNLRRFGEMQAFFSCLGSLHLLDLNTDSGRSIAAVLLAATSVIGASRTRSLTSYAMLTISALLLTLPVVHYWYLTWVLALTPLALGWVWPVTAAAFVTYFQASVVAARTGTWSMPAWAPFASWLVFAVVCAVELIRQRRRGLDGGGAAPE